MIMNEEEINRGYDVKLAAMRALLDHITHNIESVNVDLKGHNIDLYLVFRSVTIEDEDYENAEEVRRKMQEECPLDKITLHCIHIISKEYPVTKGESVFIRGGYKKSLYKGRGFEKEKDILLSLQYALCGEISKNMRAVFVDWIDEKLFLYFIFDGEISEDDIEEASCIETEFFCALTRPCVGTRLSTECIRIDAPKPIPDFGKECVYKRKEQYEV
jgi:hypothetical protein